MLEDGEEHSVPAAELPTGKVREDSHLEGGKSFKHAYVLRPHPRPVESKFAGVRHWHPMGSNAQPRMRIPSLNSQRGEVTYLGLEPSARVQVLNPVALFPGRHWCPGLCAQVPDDPSLSSGVPPGRLGTTSCFPASVGSHVIRTLAS